MECHLVFQLDILKNLLMNKIIFFLFTYSTLSAQTIKGTITDSLGVVPFASVVIKDKNELIKQFTTSDEKGLYKLQLNREKDTLFIEISTFIHQPKTINLSDFKFEKNEEIINIHLKDRVTNLKEVIIKKAPPILQKKDTLEYNPDSFKDGSEKVVEDLLKKLPGIKVEENGTIKYKGKEIKKMLLDGDDLFDTNYTIGSKNININMIEKVQGIDNYEENSLLKGIKDSDDVILNLVLKKGKTDFSGTSTLGYGIEDSYYGILSGVLVNKKVKAFGISSFNNVGQNNTPYDFSSEIISLENSRNQNLIAKSLLNEGNFNSILDNNFHRLNNNFYTSLNTLNKIYSKSSLKINLGFYQDELSRLNESNSKIFSQNEIIVINEINKLKKRPKLFDVKVHFSNKENDIFHWEYIGKVNQSKLTFNDFSSNNELIQNNNVTTNQFDTTQNLNSTLKISENEAMITSLLFSKSKTPQSLTTNPPTVIDDLGLSLAAKQKSEFQKQFLSINNSYFISNKKLKYGIHSSFFDLRNSLFSNLLNQDNQNVSDEFSNENDYNIKNFNINPVLVFNEKKYSFKIGLNAIYNNINFTDLDRELNKEAYFIVPKLTAIYRFTANKSISYNYSFNQVVPEEDKLFSGIIQTNYRDFISNDVTLEYLKTHSHSLSFNHHDFFNLTQFNILLSYDYRPNNYFQKTIINSNITVSNQFFAKISNKDYGVTVSGEKYFHPLRTTFQFNSTFNLSFDNNIINQSDLREIKNENFTINFVARRGINKRFVLENKIFYLNSNFKVEDEKLDNNFQMLTNQTKILFKSKKNVNSNLVGNFVSPNLKSNDNYFFLDYEIEFTPKNKNLTYSLIGKNLTNNKVFTTNSISSFSTNSSSHNLIERYVMFKLTFGF